MHIIVLQTVKHSNDYIHKGEHKNISQFQLVLTLKFICFMGCVIVS